MAKIIGELKKEGIGMHVETVLANIRFIATVPRLTRTASMRFRQRSKESITTLKSSKLFAILCVMIPVGKQVLRETEWCSSNVIRSLWETRLLLPAKIRVSLTTYL